MKTKQTNSRKLTSGNKWKTSLARRKRGEKEVINNKQET